MQSWDSLLRGGRLGLHRERFGEGLNLALLSGLRPDRRPAAAVSALGKFAVAVSGNPRTKTAEQNESDYKMRIAAERRADGVYVAGDALMSEPEFFDADHRVAIWVLAKFAGQVSGPASRRPGRPTRSSLC